MLVIENGYLDESPNVQVPYLSGVLSSNPPLYQSLNSAPDLHLGNRTFPVAVGNVVGGGSIVNGMMLDRGSDADYDAWEELGNVGWGWKGLEAYFRKVFTFTPPSEETVGQFSVRFLADLNVPILIFDQAAAFNISYDRDAYGKGGAVQATIASFQYPDYKVMFGAWKDERGIPLPKEGFSSPLGAFWAPNTVDNVTAERSSAKSAYYDPIKSRPNLKLLVGTHADEILFDKVNVPLKATGVKVTLRNDSSTAYMFASREVILAAGSIFTPHLLLKSGIGPSDELKHAKIAVKVDLPAVGSNLQEHVPAYMTFNLSNLAFPNYDTLATNSSFNASAAEEYAKYRTGPWTVNRGNALAFLPLKQFSTRYKELAAEVEGQEAADFLPARYTTAPTLYAGYLRQRDIILKQFRGLSGYEAAAGELPIQPNNRATAVLQKPLSRGIVRLNATDPYGYPVVEYHSMQNPVDKAVLCELIRWNRKHWKSPALARYSPMEKVPGAQYADDDGILEALVRQDAIKAGFAHPSGSCAMMARALGGCVSNQLLVYGVQRLSIVDASILPMIPATHLQATMYAVVCFSSLAQKE